MLSLCSGMSTNTCGKNGRVRKSPLETIIIKIDLSKNYQQMLRVGERLKNKESLHSLKLFLHKLLINDQRENNGFTVENLSRIMVALGLQLTSPIGQANTSCLPL